MDPWAYKAEVFFAAHGCSFEERIPFVDVLNFLEEVEVPEMGLFLHGIGNLFGGECTSLAEEDVFGNVGDAAFENNREGEIEEAPLEVWA